MSQPPLDNPKDPTLPPDRPADAPPPPPLRRKRRWPWVVLGILLVLLLLVILAPTIASTAPVRAFVVGRVNDNLNGRVAIADWSLGWTSGITVRGVKVYDDRNAEIADIQRIKTDLSLLDVIRGNYHLGNTEIDVANFVARVDENGQTNFQKLPKPDPKTPPDGDEGGELPDVSGKITANLIGRGSIEAPDQPTVHVEPSTVILNIPDINRPIENDLKLAFRVGDDPTPGTVALAGTVDAVENNRLDIDRVAADQKIELANVNLAAAQPFLKQAGQDAQLGGVANGSLHATAQGLAGISTNGEIRVSNFLVGGDMLNGDTIRSERVTIPLQVTRTIIDPDTTLIKIERLGIEMPEATVAVTGEVAQEAVQRLANNQPPGSEGKIDLRINVPDLGRIANQLPNTLKLAEGVTINSGSFAQSTSIVIQPNQVAATQRVDLTAGGERNGKPITLRPVHIETAAVAIPTGKQIPNLRNIQLTVESAFATITGGGESMAAINLNGEFDLDKLHAEAAQFVDLGEIDLAGTGSFTINTSGDPTQQAEPILAKAAVNLQNLRVAGVMEQGIDQDRLSIEASGELNRAKQMLNKGYVAIIGGDPSSPLLDVQANANVNLANNTLPWFELVRCTITDLAKVQQQYGALLPALGEQNIQLQGGQLYAQVAGRFDGTNVTLDKPLAVSIPNLTVSKDGRELLRREIVRATINGSFAMPESGISGNLTDLSITTQSKLLTVNKAGDDTLTFALPKEGAIRGNGAVALAADLKRLNDLAQAFGGQVVSPDQPQLTSGQFNGTVTLVKTDQPQTQIDFTGEMSNLTVATNRQSAIENEKVTITLKATAPDDLSGTQPITAHGKITSSFATTTLDNVKLLLSGGLYDQLQSANIDLDIPDLAKLYSLAQAFTPSPGTPGEGKGEGSPVPAEPLVISDGSAALKIALARDANLQATTLTIPDARISNLAIQRGRAGEPYRFDRETPITLKLAAALKTTGDSIDSIQVSDLAADARVVSVSMPQPITITNLTSGTPQASGAIAANGSIQNIAPVLAVIAGSEPLPYAGEFALTQNIRNDGDAIVLVGDITTRQFKAFDAADIGRVLFEEDTVAIKNDVRIDANQKVAKINALAVDMPTSGALKADVTGTIDKWGATSEGTTTLANMNGVVANLTYDLAKLWPIVKPLLATPEEPMDDVVVAGKSTRKFEINGPYYAGEMHQAIRQIQIVGDLGVQTFAQSGIEVQNLELPIYLRRGVMQTVYAGKPAAERMPKPAAFNGGTLSLGGISIDLTTPDPRLTIPNDYKLVSRATINPLLGEKLGKFVNPMFANAQRAEGLLDIRIDYCENLALGEKLKTPESGRARIVFSISDMDIANPLGSLMFGAIPGLNVSKNQADTFRGQIKDAVVTLEAGRTTQDITLDLVDPGRPADVIGSRQPVQEVRMPLRFQGDVRLSDLQQSITVSLPSQLIGRFFGSEKDRETLVRIFPEGVPLSLKGTTIRPQVDAGNIAQKFLEGQLKTGAGGFLDDLLRRQQEKDDERRRDDDGNRPRNR